MRKWLITSVTAAGFATLALTGGWWKPFAAKPGSSLLPNTQTSSDFLRKIAVLPSADIDAYPNDRRVTEMAFSRGGERLITSSLHSIKIWDVEKKILVKEVANDQDDATAFVLSPENETLVAYIEDSFLKGNLSAFDVNSGKKKFSIKHSSRIVLYSPDGKYLMTFGRCPDCNAKIWDAATGKLTATLVAHIREKGDWPGWGEEPSVKGDFSPDGKQAVTLCDDSTAEIWSVPDGKLISVLDTKAKRNSGAPININRAIFSPDGSKVIAEELVLTGSKIRISEWETRTGKLLQREERLPYLLTDDKQLLATSCGVTYGRRWFTSWDVASTGFRDLLLRLIQTDCRSDLFLSPRQKLLIHKIRRGAHSSITVYDAQTGGLRFALPPFEEYFRDRIEISVSPDEKVVTIAQYDWVNFYDAETGQLLFRIQSGGSPVVFHPQGRLLTIAQDDGNVSLWEVR